MMAAEWIKAVFPAAAVTAIMYLIAGRRYLSGIGKAWKIPMFFAGVFSVRMFFDFVLFVWISVSSSFHMERIESEINAVGQRQRMIFLLIYLPAGLIAYFLNKSMEQLPARLLHISCILMTLGSLCIGNIDRWQEVMVFMPFTLLFFLIVLFYRIKQQGEKERQLYYREQLEEQMKKKNAELDELRREVEKYYLRAQEKEAAAYPGQVLKKLDDLIDQDSRDETTLRNTGDK